MRKVFPPCDPVSGRTVPTALTAIAEKKEVVVPRDGQWVPIRFRFSLDPVPIPLRSSSDPVPIQIRTRPNPVPAPFRSGPDLVLIRFQYGLDPASSPNPVPSWFRSGSSGSDLAYAVPIRSGSGSGRVPVRFRSSSGRLPRRGMRNTTFASPIAPCANRFFAASGSHCRLCIARCTAT